MKKYIVCIMMVLLALKAQAATQFDFLLSQVRTSAQGALVGGKAYFYAAGTTTLKTIWLDKNQITTANNPYTLDANATALLYGTGSYRIVIKDAAAVVRYDRDGILMAGDDGLINAVDATSGVQTFTLPASGTVVVVKTDNTANTVIIQPSIVGHTINGLSSYTLYIQGETAHLGLSGTTWYVE